MKKTLKNFTILVAVTGIFVFMSSCDNKNNNKHLISQEWKLDRMIHGDSMRDITVPEDIYIIFSDSNMVYGNAGCNSFFGQYNTGSGSQITIGPAGSTMMWCSDAAFETNYLKLLEEVSRYQSNSAELKLYGNNDEFTLIYLPRNK